MPEDNLPEKYKINGLELIDYSPPFKDARGVECEAISYKTPSNSKFSVAKDFMGTQICKNGCFFPGFCNFRSVEDAVKYLRENTPAAIKFFDKVPDRRR
jgi:2-iminoacetate synthase ThiH